MRTLAFKRGFAETLAGAPFDPDAYRSTRDQWHYERGRQFAVVYPKASLAGNPVNAHSQLQMNALFVTKVIR